MRDVEAFTEFMHGAAEVEILESREESLKVVHYYNYVDAGARIRDFLVRRYLHEDIKRMVPNILKRTKSGGKWLSGDYLKKQ